MDLRGFRVAAAVAEHGSVTRAAAALHQSSSAASYTLLRLEDELGVPLFHRLPRGMVPTDAGRTFLTAARRALHEAELARRSVDDIRDLVSGHVTIAAKNGFTVMLGDLIGAFARDYPEVSVRVILSAISDEVAHLVHSGVCEVGFTWGARLSDLDSVRVGLVPGVVVIPDDHRLAEKSSVCIGDLHGERVVAPVSTAFYDLFRRYGVEPNIVAEASTNDMVLELVVAGVGCTVVPAASAVAVLGRGATIAELAEHPQSEVFMVIPSPPGTHSRGARVLRPRDEAVRQLIRSAPNPS